MSAERPNILLIYPDQWRGDCLSRLGHPVVETPFLDEVAAEGVTFTAAYSACPSCIAARATMATGQTPSTCGRLGYRDQVPWRYPVTLMSCLRDGGYQTFSAGKNHFYPQRNALGFEEMRLYETQTFEGRLESDYHVWLARETGGQVRDTAIEMNNNSWVVHPWTQPEHLHPSAWNTTAALELLERRDPTRPFFMQVGYHRPHPPLDPPMAYFEQYRDRPLPPVPVGAWAAEYGHRVWQSDTSTGELPPHQLDRARRAYYAQISHLDYQIQRLVYWLKKRGCWENTWVIFTSDHGELLGDHHIFRKTSGLEGSAKLPFIVRPPRSVAGPRGGLCEAPVTHMDIMPTLLQAAGLAVPETVEGQSVLPLVAGENGSWREYVHGEHAGQWALQYVTDGREKFIWNTVTGQELFFDLREDPQELHDRSADPAYAQRVELWRERLMAELAARPEDGLSDGKKLLAGKALPAVRPGLLGEAGLGEPR
jgi:arylsulfatase A-like enzyme